MLPSAFRGLSESSFYHQYYINCISHLIIPNRDIHQSVFPKSSTAMKTLSSICLLFLVLCCLTEPARSRTLLLNSCSINVPLEELYRHYSSIRLNAVSGWHHVGKPETSLPLNHIHSHPWWFLWISDHRRWRHRCEISEQIIDWWCPGEIFFLSFPHTDGAFFNVSNCLNRAKRLHQSSGLHVKSIHTSALLTRTVCESICLTSQHLSVRSARDAVSCALCCVFT